MVDIDLKFTKDKKADIGSFFTFYTRIEKVDIGTVNIKGKTIKKIWFIKKGRNRCDNY